MKQRAIIKIKSHGQELTRSTILLFRLPLTLDLLGSHLPPPTNIVSLPRIQFKSSGHQILPHASGVKLPTDLSQFFQVLRSIAFKDVLIGGSVILVDEWVVEILFLFGVMMGD